MTASAPAAPSALSLPAPSPSEPGKPKTNVAADPAGTPASRQAGFQAMLGTLVDGEPLRPKAPKKDQTGSLPTTVVPYATATQDVLALLLRIPSAALEPAAPKAASGVKGEVTAPGSAAAPTGKPAPGKPMQVPQPAGLVVEEPVLEIHAGATHQNPQPTEHPPARANAQPPEKVAAATAEQAGASARGDSAGQANLAFGMRLKPVMQPLTPLETPGEMQAATPPAQPAKIESAAAAPTDAARIPTAAPPRQPAADAPPAPAAEAPGRGVSAPAPSANQPGGGSGQSGQDASRDSAAAPEPSKKAEPAREAHVETATPSSAGTGANPAGQPGPAAPQALHETAPSTASPSPKPVVAAESIAPGAANSAAAHDIRLEVNGGAGQRVEVRLVERAGEVQVAVRTQDSSLATTLRSDLPALAARLEQSGFRADSWHTQPTAALELQRLAAAAGAPSNPDSRDQPRQRGGQPQDNPQQQNPKNAGNSSNRKLERKGFEWLLQSLR